MARTSDPSPSQPDLVPEREPGDESEAAPSSKPSTAVTKAATVKPEDKPEAIGTLPEALQNALRLRAIDRKMNAAVAGQSWGKGLDAETRAAVGQYLQKWNIDVTEIDILGGNIYRNARFYLSRLAHLVAAGEIEYAVADHVANDPRLALLAKDEDETIARSARAESARRMQERLAHAVPEDAIVAVVFRVKLRRMEREVTGCRWMLANPVNDPVGKAKPVETTESRAARRAMRQVVPNLPQAEVLRYQQMEQEMIELSARTGLAIALNEAAGDERSPGSFALPDGARIRSGAHEIVTPVKSDADPFKA